MAINMALEIKEVDKSNAAEVAALAKIIWNEHFTPIIGKAQVEYMLEKFQSERAIREQIEGGAKYIAVCSGGEMIGYSCYKLEANALFLSKLYVRSDKRGQGAGKKLFEYELEAAKKESKPKIYLTVNKHNDLAIGVYKHLGFVCDSSAVTDIGGGFVMDDYIMAYYL